MTTAHFGRIKFDDIRTSKVSANLRLFSKWGADSRKASAPPARRLTHPRDPMDVTVYPAYTEDITVAGSLVRDKIHSFCQKIIRNSDEEPSATLKVDKVLLVDRLGAEASIVGTIHITTTHLIFRAEDGSKELWLPNGLIANVERGPLSVTGCPLVIRCKHFMIISLLITRDKQCQDLLETLKKCADAVNVNDLPAFESRDLAEDARGWSRMDWEIEFSRQGVSEAWKETNINRNYASCDTYPDRLWVPTSSTTDVLMGSCKFRSRGRLPALTYYYKPTAATICRCAQPLTGFSARCVEDEKLMSLVGKANPQCETLYLIDTRPRVNAMVNKVQGKGFEDERNYDNLKFHFFDIENIHVMRASQQKLLEACSRAKTVTDYWKLIETSGWLKHVRSLVECGLFLADSITRGISCVVHCSDGWDRTSQVVSLAQLLLDPFYRTVHGFQVLIEKDWLGFGHKFDDRCGHVGALNDEAGKEISPVFTQFLDCVFQIMIQKPRAFQFNERYLIQLHEHAYSCQFGTFIGNCDKDRKDLFLAKRTKSLWTYLDARQDDFLNPFYEPTTFTVLLDIDTRAANYAVWNGLYNRFDEGLLCRESLADTAMATMEHVGVLESHIAACRMRIAELKMTLGKNPGSMADSGHSSNGGTVSAEESNPLERSPSRESGVFDQSLSYSEEVLTRQPLRWQSLKDADHCSAEGCRTEFTSVADRKIHCHRCGKIFCRRCLKVTADERERVCEACRKL